MNDGLPHEATHLFLSLTVVNRDAFDGEHRELLAIGTDFDFVTRSCIETPTH